MYTMYCTHFNSTLVIRLKFVFIEMLDKLITYIQLNIRYCPLRELTASQLFATANRSVTGSHNGIDLIQSRVPPHYVCNGYLSNIMHVFL